jgi:fluoride exporter
LLKYVMVGVGGFIGAIARFWVGSYIGERMGTRFPYGTFVINISGSFLVGFIWTLLTAKAHLSPNWGYLIPVGFIGAYTTFSTFEFETLRSIQDGQFVMASLNVVLSVLLGFIAVWAGAVAGKVVP